MQPMHGFILHGVCLAAAADAGHQPLSHRGRLQQLRADQGHPVSAAHCMKHDPHPGEQLLAAVQPACFLPAHADLRGLLQELVDRNVAGQRPGPLPALRGTSHEEFCSRRPCSFLHKVPLLCGKSVCYPRPCLRSMAGLQPAPFLHQLASRLSAQATGAWAALMLTSCAVSLTC